MEKILLATNNPHKLREFSEILPNVISPADLGITHDTIEDADTFLGNALKKAREMCEIAKMPVIADDSGICVQALGDAPGVYSARYSGGDDEANNDKLLSEMQGVTDRAAKYVAVIVYYRPDGSYETATGEFHGEIAHERSGTGGFGYDSIFYLPALRKTAACLTPDEKNAMSHRGKAVREIIAKIKMSA